MWVSLDILDMGTDCRESVHFSTSKSTQSHSLERCHARASRMLSILAIGISLVSITTLQGGGAPFVVAQTNPRVRIVEADVGVVAADEARCSVIGRDTLKGGGNAVDAVVATALCQGVVNPMASGIGGGAFLLVRLANGTAKAFDMRETAPAAASQAMYAKSNASQLLGGLSVGVPGELAGLYEAWKLYGQKPWASLFKPAISLAQGFRVAPYLAASINASAGAILSHQGLHETFAPNGTLLRAGDICYRKNLAKTLEKVAQRGIEAFYGGETANILVADVQAAGGILTADDLNKYRVVIREPLVTQTMGYTLLGFPPPSSGGACLSLILNILASYRTPEAVQGTLGIHRMVEAFKNAYAVREFLGDPDFVNTTSVLAQMLSPKFAAQLQRRIRDNSTFGPKYYGGRWNVLDDHGTSHISIIDGNRNAASMTTTVNTAFGSKVLSQATGILLNNEMGDFSIPGPIVANQPPPAQANFVHPGKRPLSSMSPTIVLENGQLRGVLGGSGGIRIITTTAQVFLNYFVKRVDPLHSVTRPRVHHQWLPNVLEYENWTTAVGDDIEVKASIRRALHRKGHHLQSGSTGAVSQLVVQRLDLPASHHGDQPPSATRLFFGKLIGVSDLRKDGRPAGF